MAKARRSGVFVALLGLSLGLAALAATNATCGRQPGGQGGSGRGGSGGANTGVAADSGHGGVAGTGGYQIGTSDGPGGAAGSGSLLDPTGWSPVPGGTECGLYEAAAPQLGLLPRRSWEACGTGCQVAKAANIAGDSAVYRSATDAAVVGTELFLRVVSAASGYRLSVLSRISDARATSATLQRGGFATCFPFATTQAPQLTGVVGQGGVILTGFADVTGGSIVWSPLLSGMPDGGRLFANDTGWGDAFSAGWIGMLVPPSASTMTTIDQTQTARAVAIADRVAWSTRISGYAGEVLKGYTPAEGAMVIAAQTEFQDHVLALSADKVVWVGTTGPDREFGNYVSAQFFWAPWPTPLAPASINAGAIVGGSAGAEIQGLNALGSWGDYAAATGCTAADQMESCDLYVTQLSTAKLWRIPRRPSSLFLDVLAISDREILVSEVDDPDPSVYQEIQRFLRLDLAHLDELARGW